MESCVVVDSPYAYSATPSTSTVSRQNVGGFGVARRLTPSGDISTRRSDTSAAPASAGRTSRKITVPPTAPRKALTMASADAMTRMSAGVPPTRRSAASRSSRRPAASRVAVLISTSIGNTTARTPTRNA
jgi:hypothetical protein